MKEYKKVYGTMETVPTIEINVDTVYLRSNIIKIENEDFDCWEYDEIQYTTGEYIQIMADNQVEMQNTLNELLKEIWKNK